MTFSAPEQSLLAEVKRMHDSDDCNIDLLTKYLDQGADPNAKPEQGDGALEILLNPAVDIEKYKRLYALALMVERGGNLLIHGAKLIALFEESITAGNFALTAGHFVLPAMVERQRKSGSMCADEQGNTPLHWMVGSSFTMLAVKSLLEDWVEAQEEALEIEDPDLHDDWLHAVNAQGNTPMMMLWLAMLKKTKSDTEFECDVAFAITSHLLTLGGNMFLTNHKGECAVDLMAQYHELHYADRPDPEEALWSEIIAWKMRKRVKVATGKDLPRLRL